MKPAKPLESLILTIRGRKVLIDADLAVIYGVETRSLNQAVKRNAERFPEDFMFCLSAVEKSEVITNCDHLAILPHLQGEGWGEDGFIDVRSNSTHPHPNLPLEGEGIGLSDPPKRRIGFRTDDE